MSALSSSELQNVRGGGWKAIALVVVGIGILAWGIVDGYVRPNSCK